MIRTVMLARPEPVIMARELMILAAVLGIQLLALTGSRHASRLAGAIS